MPGSRLHILDFKVDKLIHTFWATEDTDGGWQEHEAPLDMLELLLGQLFDQPFKCAIIAYKDQPDLQQEVLFFD